MKWFRSGLYKVSFLKHFDKQIDGIQDIEEGAYPGKWDVAFFLQSFS